VFISVLILLPSFLPRTLPVIQRSTPSTVLPEAGLFAGKGHFSVFLPAAMGQCCFSFYFGPVQGMFEKSQLSLFTLFKQDSVYHKFSKKETLFSEKTGKEGKV